MREETVGSARLVSLGNRIRQSLTYTRTLFEHRGEWQGLWNFCMMSSIVPKTNMVKSVSEEMSEGIYEDPDALLTEIHSQEKKEEIVKPIPLPRIKSSLYINNNYSSNAAPNPVKSSSLHEKRPMMGRPVRPAPLPPESQDVTSTPTAGRRSSKPLPPKVGGTPPPPPPRPDKSTLYSYYGQVPSPTNPLPESFTGTPQQSRRSSTSSTVPRPVSPRLSPSGEWANLSFTSQAEAIGRQNRTLSVPCPGSSHPSLPSRSSSVTEIRSPGLNYYNERDFPTYLEIISDEPPHGRIRSMSHHNTDNQADIYQLTTDDIPGLLEWLKSESNFMAPPLHGLSIEEQIRFLDQRAMNVRKARRLYNLLMMSRKESLQNVLKEFDFICEKLNKVKKTNRNMGIAGGTTGAVGGVAAVVGIALAPVTMGASLVATAVGAGMIAAGGGFGAHAARVNKKIVNRTTVEKMVNDYKSGVVDMEDCLQFMLSEMDELRRHDFARLHSTAAHPDTVRMTKLAHTLFNSNTSRRGMSVIHPGGGTSGSLLKAFADEMDSYFTENNNQKLKKSNKSKFSGRVCTLTQNLKEQLDYLNQMWAKLC
ncbi:uncharacterized protein ACNS7B_010341 isoform 1-T1 [Menidia menidia]